ncbi:MAG: glycosyltransferase [Parasphingopyxis sp.]|nr:glycosyltransferase [Sphingomonadales bacterium]
MGPAHILHLHSTFSLGGKEARAVRIINDLGDAVRHTIVSAMPDALGAREAIDPGVSADFPRDAPPLAGRPGPGRFRALAAYMRRFDLVLTYNWGALDGVMAHRLGGRGLPPIIHHEDGFNADEAERLKPTRNLYRRLAFPTLARLVVPSRRLETIAREVWKQPEERVARIANGIAVDRYADPEPGAIPGFARREGEIVIGTVAGLRAVKDLPRLVRAVAQLSTPARLVIVGEGPERDAIAAEAERCDIAGRLVMPGFLDRPWRYVGLFDIFALSSHSEQFPISLVEAMAAGQPVAAPDVGDVAAMVATENRSLIGSDLVASLDKLARDADLRASLGAANRAKARAEFDERRMLVEYRRLYGSALGNSERFAR